MLAAGLNSEGHAVFERVGLSHFRHDFNLERIHHLSVEIDLARIDADFLANPAIGIRRETSGDDVGVGLVQHQPFVLASEIQDRLFAVANFFQFNAVNYQLYGLAVEV